MAVRGDRLPSGLRASRRRSVRTQDKPQGKPKSRPFDFAQDKQDAGATKERTYIRGLEDQRRADFLSEARQSLQIPPTSVRETVTWISQSWEICCLSCS